MRPNNDVVAPLFEWYAFGGERNIRKTLPHIDVWIDFRWDTSRPKDIIIPEHVAYHHLPFDDGDLDAGVRIWKQAMHLIRPKEQSYLVTCSEGVSRSAIFSLWVSCRQLGRFEEAWQHVKSKRNIFPDRAFRPFLQQLKKRYPTWPR